MNPTVDRDDAQTAPIPADDEISAGYANYVLGMLLVVNIMNFVDRQVLSIFIGPIKAEFGISDTSMGFLVGFAFAIFYTIAGIPIARLADRSSRRNIIAVGIALWSAMTVASGLARSFLHLALARVFVGIGEAAASPPSHSLLSDYFPVNRRATAIGIYASGVYLGSAIAYLFGGYLRANFDWRIAFFVLGVPGLLVALIIRFTVREEPKNALVRQYQALLLTEGIELRFSDDAVQTIADLAAEVNEKSENIGARRLHTILEKLLDVISFEAPDMKERKVDIDAAYVRKMLSDIVKDQDLSRYIL